MTFYITFGMGTLRRNCFVKVEAENEMAAREIVVEHYGPKWSGIYSEEEFKGQPEQYGLTELALGEDPPIGPTTFPAVFRAADGSEVLVRILGGIASVATRSTHGGTWGPPLELVHE